MLYITQVDASIITGESTAAPTYRNFMSNNKTPLAQMRISDDVLAIAQAEQTRLGLRNPKEAIESMVRRYARREQPRQETTNGTQA